MSVKTKIPTSHINDYDVADTLNANGGKVGAWEDMFKAEANINSDSKHKPIVLNVRFCQDFDSSKKHYLKDWWKGPDGLCGYSLSKAKANGWTALPSKYDGKKNGWEYVPPYGQGTPLRPNDFAGYYPGAKPLVQGFYVPTSVFADNTSAECQITLPASNEDSLSWSDFDTLKSYYFGVMIYYSDNDYMRITATISLKDDGGTVKFNPSKLAKGRKYTVYPFICSNRYAYDDLDSSGQVIYAMPNIQPAAMEVKTSSVRILVIAQKNNANRTVTWSVSATAESSVSLSNNSIWIYREGETQASSGDVTVSMPDVTLSAGVSTLIDSGTATMRYDVTDTEFAALNLWIDVSLGGGRYTTSQMVAFDINQQ